MDCCSSAKAPLYLRCHGAGHHHPDGGDRHAHAGRYLSRDQHSGHQRGVELHRLCAQRDGRPHRHQLRARHDHHRQRYRAHRVAVGERRGRHQDLLPPAGQHPDARSRRSRPSCKPPSADCLRAQPAAGHLLFRVLYSDGATRPQQQDPARAATVRPRTELPAQPIGHGAWRGHAVSLRRQDPPGAGGPRPAAHAGQRTYAERHCQRHQCPEPHHSLGHRQDRLPRIPAWR